MTAPTLAKAQAPMDQTGYATPTGNVIGGGGASLSGGGNDGVILYSGGGAGGGARYEQVGRTGIFGGNSSGSPYWTYGEAPALTGGREAWLIGGGDDGTVVYNAPAGMRRR